MTYNAKDLIERETWACDDDPEAESPRASDVESEWDFPMRPNLDDLRATAVSLPSRPRHRSVRSNTGHYGASAACGWTLVAEWVAILLAGLMIFKGAVWAYAKARGLL